MTELIHNMFHIPEDIYTHYTPWRYLINLYISHYNNLDNFKGHLPDFKYYIFEICYLSIQGKILQEQQNNYKDLYNSCHHNLLCHENFKKTAINYLQLINQQISYHRACLLEIRGTKVPL
jgi:hypothetical protein